MDQDSLDDYVKLSQNTDESKLDKSKINSIITTALKKRESEDRAIKIIELLMEGTARPETFLKSIMYLNTTYYQDLVEERALTKVCGYPLCGKKISPISNKRYSISTKNNRVYDLSEYGHFCSISCFNASNHIKNQIDDSPLWLRELENMPTFNLLPKGKGHVSKGVDLKSKRPCKENEDFTPVSSFAEMSLDDFINFEDKKTKNNKTKQFKLSTVIEEVGKPGTSQNLKKTKRADKYNLETVDENFEEEISEELCEDRCKNIPNKDISEVLENTEESLKESAQSLGDFKYLLNSYVPPITKQKYSSDDKLKNITAKIKKNSKISAVKIIEPQPIPIMKDRSQNPKDLKELNEKIKNKFAKPTVKLIDPLPKTSEIEKLTNKTIKCSGKSEIESKLKDLSLLKLKFSLKNSVEVENQVRDAVRNWISLDTLIFVHGEDKIREILDEKKISESFDNLKVDQLEVYQQKKYIDICKRLHLQELLENKWDSAYTGADKLQPLTDYNKLKVESKQLDIKVKTFYGGMLYEADDSNFPLKETKEKVEEEGVPAVIPLVDINSQNALRRRVLLSSLNKGVKFFLDVIQDNSVDVFSDLQDLVKTFKLTANNVVFKPIVWYYLGLVCLKILALKDSILRNQLNGEEAVELENLMLSELPQGNKVVLNCLNLMHDVDSFIEIYVMTSSA